MKAQAKGIIRLMVAVLSCFCLAACATNGTRGPRDAVKWAGALKGTHGITGEIEFYLIKPQMGQEYQVDGTFNLKATSTPYGSISCRLSMKGTISEGVFNTRLFGNCLSSNGVTLVVGRLMGTMAESVAYGTWTVRHDTGEESGDWTAKAE